MSFSNGKQKETRGDTARLPGTSALSRPGTAHPRRPLSGATQQDPIRKPQLVYSVTHEMSVRLLAWEHLQVLADRYCVHLVVGELSEWLRRELSAIGVNSTWELNLLRRPHPFSDAKALASAVRLLRTIQPDIVHASTPKAATIITLAGWLAQVPIRAVTVRGAPWESVKNPGRLGLKIMDRIVLSKATHIHFISESLRQLYQDERLFEADRHIVFCRNSSKGVDPTRFQPVAPKARMVLRNNLGFPAEACLIGYVGRIARSKGLEELAYAWINLRDRVSNTLLIVCGDVDPSDPPRPGVLDVLHQDPRVLVMPARQNIESVLQSLDVLALPSHREGFGNVVLEAASCAVPAVATDVTGCRDAVVDGITGLLVPRDPVALARGLEDLTTSQDLRLAMGLAARDRSVREFCQSDVLSSVARMYSDSVQ